MPRYVIDTDDGRTFVAGDLEASFDCPYKARAIADRALGAMTEDSVPDGFPRVLRAIVRNEGGQEVYVATITFVGRWKGPLVA